MSASSSSCSVCASLVTALGALCDRIPSCPHASIHWAGPLLDGCRPDSPCIAWRSAAWGLKASGSATRAPCFAAYGQRPGESWQQLFAVRHLQRRLPWNSRAELRRLTPKCPAHGAAWQSSLGLLLETDEELGRAGSLLEMQLPLCNLTQDPGSLANYRVPWNGLGKGLRHLHFELTRAKAMAMVGSACALTLPCICHCLSTEGPSPLESNDSKLL